MITLYPVQLDLAANGINCTARQNGLNVGKYPMGSVGRKKTGVKAKIYPIPWKVNPIGSVGMKKLVSVSGKCTQWGGKKSGDTYLSYPICTPHPPISYETSTLLGSYGN